MYLRDDYLLNKNIAKTVLATYFIIILRHRKPFHVNTLKSQTTD